MLKTGTDITLVIMFAIELNLNFSLTWTINFGGANAQSNPQDGILRALVHLLIRVIWNQ